jgi:hypothetical protein
MAPAAINAVIAIQMVRTRIHPRFAAQAWITSAVPWSRHRLVPNRGRTATASARKHQTSDLFQTDEIKPAHHSTECGMAQWHSSR